MPRSQGFHFYFFPGPKTRFDLVLVPKNFFAGPNFQFFLQQLMSPDGRTDARTHGRRRISPGPRPPPIPDRGRACRRILYREVTSSVPPLQFQFCLIQEGIRFLSDEIKGGMYI